ncbi:MAG: sterol desaturase family protein [Myxococcales bacterium]|nr:sterol desaturase family protein [Myxococcales bacterium]MCB9715616.1 sterol desaturase family protein [Myxococcales bacterium]
MPDGSVASSRGPAPLAEGADARVWRARDKASDPSFSLARHLSQTLGIAIAIGALGLWLAWGSSPLAWLAVPGFWLVANVFEWATHRYPMHRPLFPRVLYLKHAIAHHRAFAGEHQEIRARHELSAVMMPWYTLIIIFVGASPIAVAVGLAGGPALAGVFLVSAVAYFLVYELIHTLHHLPGVVLRRSWLGRRRGVAALRAHHHLHHQLARMNEVNFNVTFPLADRLLGTYERSSRG